MSLDIKECERFLEKWQKILRLRDWDIKIRIVDTQWRKSGDIKIDECNRQAILMLNGNNPRIDNVEEVIIHEYDSPRIYNTRSYKSLCEFRC